jgi:hypothetical protein
MRVEILSTTGVIKGKNDTESMVRNSLPVIIEQYCKNCGSSIEHSYSANA